MAMTSQSATSDLRHTTTGTTEIRRSSGPAIPRRIRHAMVFKARAVSSNELRHDEPSQTLGTACMTSDVLVNGDNCQTSGGPRLRPDLRKKVSERFG